MEVRLSIKYSYDGVLVMSPFDLLDTYFYGIDTRAKDGSVIPDHVYRSFILSAQQEIEKYLAIKILPQVVEESHNYYGDDWKAWGLINTSYPVNAPISLVGYYGSQEHFRVEPSWLVSKRSSDDLFHRAIWMLPNGMGSINYNPLITGGAQLTLNRMSGFEVPAYWRVRYVTGFNVIPMDLVNMVGMLASMSVFNLLGDIILGAGIASQSIGIDGLSQSISTTSSAENSGYSARISMYMKQMKDTLPRLKEHYTGIKFTVA